jgi:hypothetical protein
VAFVKVPRVVRRVQIRGFHPARILARAPIILQLFYIPFAGASL